MYKESHPTMGAWIEISISTKYTMDLLIEVAPHDGCVD